MESTLKARLHRAFRLTYQLVDHLSEAALGLDLPGVASNRISSQVWCMVGARQSYAAAIEAGEWRGFSCSLTTPNDKAAVLAALEETQSWLDSFDLVGLTDTQVGFAFDLLEHEIQHHGQLIRYVYGNGLNFPTTWHDRYTV